MKQRFTLFLLTLLSFTIAFAGPVDLERARGKAIKFMKEHNNGAILLSDEPEYAPARSIKGVPTDESTPAYYVFNAENECGYVIVSGDDKTDDILGYATSGSFDLGSMPENVKAWLQGYTEQIALMANYAPQQNATTANSATWQAVAPLTTTKWNQGEPYNNKCPLHNQYRSVTGCTATAMAQVMKYHEWPKAATQPVPGYTTGSYSLTLPALGSTTFRWDEMKDVYYSGEDGDAVAELMLYCGQSILSDYSNGETGAYPGDAAIALKKYFNYDRNLEMKYLFFHTISEWEEIIYNELKASRPVFHAGYSMGGGHAFVCDGYDGNGMFHFNWGWGGAYDGYYKMALLNPGTGGIGSGSSDGYSGSQQIIIGIQPPTGEAESLKYFEPLDEQIIETTMYSFFYNTHAEEVTANVGFATIDENNNIINVVKDCGSMTLAGSLQEWKYVHLDFADDNIKINPGTHRIATVCRALGSRTWKRVGSSQKFFEVTVSPTGTVTNIVQHPTINASLTWKFTGNSIVGVQQDFTVTVNNKGDDFSTTLYMFASKTSVMGKAHSYANVLLKKNESIDLNLFFKPTSTGTWNVWISKSSDGSSYIAKNTVTIKSAPLLPSNLEVLGCSIDPNKVRATIPIKNNSTEGYYRDIIIAFAEYDYIQNGFYITQQQVFPGNIEAGKTKTYTAQFENVPSNTVCAVAIFYYAKHTDTSPQQLGYAYRFTSGETPIESIEATPTEQAPVYRLDGTKVVSPAHNGIYISEGKKIVVK